MCGWEPSWRATPRRMRLGALGGGISASRANAIARASAAASACVVTGATNHVICSSSIVTDGTVAGPVLGVGGVVGDRRIEPQPVCLLAMVERPSRSREAVRRRVRPPRRPRRRWPAPRPRPPRPRRPRRARLRGALPPRPWPPRPRHARPRPPELGGDQRVVLGLQVDLVVEVRAGSGGGHLVVGQQVVPLLEPLDLLDGDLELVGDPRVGATPAHPAADRLSSCGRSERRAIAVREPIGRRAHGGRVTTSRASRGCARGRGGCARARTIVRVRHPTETEFSVLTDPEVESEHHDRRRHRGVEALHHGREGAHRHPGAARHPRVPPRGTWRSRRSAAPGR